MGEGWFIFHFVAEEKRERGIWFSSWQNWLGLDYTAAAIAVTMFRFMMMSFLKLFRGEMDEPFCLPMR
ncbi:hypothetical protein MRB53_025697 [Persea americana]|uniref:Uncharacterized protein n=1 Tax=Persea americana TaxID=3435 RepID=A0ACC2LGM7_PERAE|nr:hypothetical protein MRB53_025697 [Persea americana]